MKYPEPSFSVHVDVTNPGQFFACCGLFELAHRLWSEAEGWFDMSRSVFSILVRERNCTLLDHLVAELKECDLSGLSDAELQERKALETEKRQLERLNQTLPSNAEARRKSLGKEARGGKILLAQPFQITLDWWQTTDADPASPKTWAGRQELHKIARSAQDALPTDAQGMALFDHGDVMRKPREYCKNERQQNEPVQPFYFDARRFAHSLDTGFSLDTQDAETTANPAVELSCLIGLQRFRPAQSSVKWSFEYQTWARPLSAPVAAGVASCAAPMPAATRYRFPLKFRDDQKRYKAFGFATAIGDHT